MGTLKRPRSASTRASARRHTWPLTSNENQTCSGFRWHGLWGALSSCSLVFACVFCSWCNAISYKQIINHASCGQGKLANFRGFLSGSAAGRTKRGSKQHENQKEKRWEFETVLVDFPSTSSRFPLLQRLSRLKSENPDSLLWSH